MVGMLVMSVVDCGFNSGLDQAKDNEIGMCCFLAKHAI